VTTRPSTPTNDATAAMPAATSQTT